MAKKVKAVVTLQIAAGKANPAPPIGPALAQHGINLMAFCKEYNARTANRVGDVVPAEITIFTDGSFKFDLKSPPTGFLILRAPAFRRGHPARMRRRSARSPASRCRRSPKSKSRT